MSIRDIVVDACPKSDTQQTLERALEIATAFDAKLVVAAYAWPVTTASDVLAGSSFTIQKQTQEMEDALKSTRDAFHRVFADAPIDVEWCAGISDPDKSLSNHLLTADLLITSASEGHGCVTPEPAGLAQRTGTPVLRLGTNVATGRFPNILVAWKDCPQARRALHDALPILKRAEKVTVVSVGDEVSAVRLAAVAEHLRRHHVTTSYLHLPHSEQDVCADLVGHALRENADMIVAGAYSRGPFTERILGGVTRELLKTVDLSWFMAH